MSFLGHRIMLYGCMLRLVVRSSEQIRWLGKVLGRSIPRKLIAAALQVNWASHAEFQIIGCR